MNVRGKSLAITICIISSSFGCLPRVGYSLPAPEDTPEEILRTEIILEGRSPVDGKLLSASQYEELQAELAKSTFKPKIDADIQQVIFLLQIRKFIKTIIPFY